MALPMVVCGSQRSQRTGTDFRTKAVELGVRLDTEGDTVAGSRSSRRTVDKTHSTQTRARKVRTGSWVRQRLGGFSVMADPVIADPVTGFSRQSSFQEGEEKAKRSFGANLARQPIDFVTIDFCGWQLSRLDK
jgi:hypothetical protein